ncbi:MAG: sirohydrochlorin cobaltochelatase [Victivallales bacterium]|jgi:sirohydrochlorin cobaltochelatase
MSRILVLVLMTLSCVLYSQEQSEPKGKNMDAILLVTFGTSDQEARKGFANIERLARAKFPGYEIRWAYTSEMIRKKLAKKAELFDSPEQAMKKLREAGIRKVFVQSLHIIPGAEFNEIAKAVSQFKNDLVEITVSPPLLNSMDDVRKSVRIMLSKVPSERRKEDAVLFMGHGSGKHPSDMIYVAVAYDMGKSGGNAFLATVEGNPTFNEILAQFKEKKIKKVYLMPFMSVAGDHAKNDMAGDDPDSWKSILAKNGIESVPVMKGMAEYDEIVNIWLEHLDKTIKGL